MFGLPQHKLTGDFYVYLLVLRLRELPRTPHFENYQISARSTRHNILQIESKALQMADPLPSITHDHDADIEKMRAKYAVCSLKKLFS